ncbi:MAG: hypothetical protein ACRYGR_00625, partial [Janthinobacterium lividum]
YPQNTMHLPHLPMANLGETFDLPKVRKCFRNPSHRPPSKNMDALSQSEKVLYWSTDVAAAEKDIDKLSIVISPWFASITVNEYIRS